MTEMKNAIDTLKRMNACGESIRWLESLPGDTILAQAWEACERGDWMLWLVGRTTRSDPWSEERKPLVRVALECAKLAWKWTPDSGRWCIELYGRWVNGEDIPKERLISARRSAYDAAYDAAARKNTLKLAAGIVRKHYPVCPLSERVVA